MYQSYDADGKIHAYFRQVYIRVLLHNVHAHTPYPVLVHTRSRYGVNPLLSPPFFRRALFYYDLNKALCGKFVHFYCNLHARLAENKGVPIRRFSFGY